MWRSSAEGEFLDSDCGFRRKAMRTMDKPPSCPSTGATSRVGTSRHRRVKPNTQGLHHLEHGGETRVAIV